MDTWQSPALIAADLYHPPVWATLLAIASVLGIAALASLGTRP